MPLYEYRAVAPDGAVTEGEMEAADQQEVIHRLQASDYLPIRAHAKGSRPQGAAGGWLTGLLAQPAGPRRDRLSRRQLALFTQGLAGMLGAGLTVEQALAVQRRSGEARIAAVADRLLVQVRGGDALSQALARPGAGFPPLCVAMARAGEAGGTLPQSLARLAAYLERARAAADQVTSALIYPVILVTFAGLSLAFLMTVVLPQFEQMFAAAGHALPWPTAALIGLSHVVADSAWLLLLLLLAAWLGLRLALRRPAGRRTIHAALLRLPLAGSLWRQIDAERFVRSLGALLGGGVALPQAVQLAADALGNQAIADHLRQVAQGLRQGEGLADAIAAGGLLPAGVDDLLRVGEATGRLGPLASQAAELQAQEIEARVKRLIAVLVPALTLVLGALIAGIILSVLAAVLGLNELVL
jgi:general secretion pathway protein F